MEQVALKDAFKTTASDMSLSTAKYGSFASMDNEAYLLSALEAVIPLLEKWLAASSKWRFVWRAGLAGVVAALKLFMKENARSG